MSPTLNITVKLQAFADVPANSNPRLKIFDWTRDNSGIEAQEPQAEGHVLAPGASKTIFSGLRPTTLDGTTAFGVALLNTDPSSYRFTWTGGTNPTLRTGRSLTPAGMTLTFVVNANASVTVTSSAALFGSVQAGDSVFIPNTTTGDTANVINVINSGYWTVLSVNSTTSLTLVRPTGQDFEGIGESVLLSTNSQFRAYSAAGVQSGDSVDISAGFNASTQKIFKITNVTDLFFEVVSTSPLANESGIIPTATGMIFYEAAKKLVYIESSQECVVRTNGDTGDTQRIEPTDASDSGRPGMYMKVGPTWSLVIVNKSTSSADLIVIHSE